MKNIFYLFCFFFSFTCLAQNNSEIIVKRIENKLYLIDNGIKYDIDETKILAKLNPQHELPKNLHGSAKDLGFGILEIPTPDSIKTEVFVSQMKRTGDFKFVDYNTKGKYHFIPNDSLIDDQWYLDRIHVYNAWDITTGDPSIKLAVIDSGVDSCHYDLHYGLDDYTNLDVSNGYDYIHNSTYHTPSFFHGTMVAGILGAKTHNGIGISGITGGNHSSGITIIPYNVGDDTPSKNHIVSAIYSAVQKGVKIINMSFGFDYDATLSEAINSAYNQGVTMICSTGNDGNPSILFPASHPYTIAVGASNKSNMRAMLSNYGDGLDLVAPGVDITSTNGYNGYNSGDGTSIAAPQVAGVVALMLSVNPTLTPSQIRSILRSTCIKLPDYTYNIDGWNNEVGYGLLNAYEAVKAVTPYISGELVPCFSSVYKVENLPSSFSVTWSLSNSSSAFILTQNSPQNNQCTITNLAMNPTESNLIAKLWFNGEIVKTLTKHIQSDITTGTFSQTGTTYQGITYPNIQNTDFPEGTTICVNPMCFVRVSAPYFDSMSFNHTGASPSIWSCSMGEIHMKFPYSSSIQTMNVSGVDGCRSFNFTVRVYPENAPIILETIGNGNGYDISLNIQDDVNESNRNQRSGTFEWNIDIRNAETGYIVFEDHVVGKTINVNTTDWPSGVYVVHATMNGQETTCKIAVK